MMPCRGTGCCALRFAESLLLQPAARNRVLMMRSTFRRCREHLAAVAIVAHKPAGSVH